MKKNLAYTFADTPEYLIYALVLFKSYRENVSKADKLKLFIPGFTSEIMDVLKHFEKHINEMEIEISFCNPIINAKHFSKRFYKVVSLYPNDFVKLMGILETEYEHAVFFDSDMLVVGDIAEAYSGDFNYTDGPASPLNSGFFSVRTSTLDALNLLDWVAKERFHENTGWNGHYLEEDHRCRETTQGQLYAYYVLDNSRDRKVKMLAQKEYNCQFHNDYAGKTKILHFTAAGKPLRYLYKNTPNIEWKDYSTWHTKWHSYAEKIDVFSDNFAYWAFKRSLSRIDRFKHDLRKNYRKAEIFGL